jgi:magnesium-transporting ATPase (P-type)
MLWINLIMDTLGGLAFAGEAPLQSYMEEPPKGRDEPILNRYMVSQILWLGGYTVTLCLAFLKCPLITRYFRPAEDNIYLLTAFFALFIFCSVWSCFQTRTDRLNIIAGLTRNQGFCFIMAAILLVQLLFVYLGGAVLRTAPLTAKELWVTFLLSLSVFPAEGIRRVWRRLSGKSEGY